MNLLRELFLTPVHIYRALLSPLKGMSTCRYTPSCSEYFLLSVRKHGIIKGSILGLSRLSRCRNKYLGGNDPVPDKYSFKYVRDQYVVWRKPKDFDKTVKRN